MKNTLDNKDWKFLLERIQIEKCTPFLGAGINNGVLPLGSKIAQELAKEYDYPFEDSSDLAKVTQFMAINYDRMFPKEEILKLLKKQLEQWQIEQCQKKVTLSDFFKAPDEPLSVLADLPFSIYMTTNYDDLMVKALKTRQKDPRRELCRWKEEFVKKQQSVFDSASGFNPTPVNPVVFHLHGHDEVPGSLVLTEDDYIDFLVNISKQQDLLPPRIQESLTGTSLLFIGYRLADLNFRVLFRGLVNSMDAGLRRISVAVQLPPEGLEQESQKRQQEYLVAYFGNINVKVYWGTAKQFAAELRDRWEEFTK